MNNSGERRRRKVQEEWWSSKLHREEDDLRGRSAIAAILLTDVIEICHPRRVPLR